MSCISVIVPVYRVEDYLDRCVQSVLDQTFSDFELILVDDGSPDNCGEMCDVWATRDARIRVIHKQNGGLSDARNVGLNVAAGEWVTFLDSDDYLHPNMLSALYTGAKKHDVSVCVGGFCRTDGEPLPEPEDGWDAVLWHPADFYRQDIVTSTIACAKLYRKACFQEIRFPLGKLHEDEYVTYRILFACREIAVIKAAGYAYFRNENSITSNGWSSKRLDVLEALEQQIAYFKENNHKELYLMRTRDFAKYIARFMKEISETVEFEKYENVWRHLKKKGRRYLRKNWHTGVFELGRDGWLILYFYPGIVKIHSAVHIALKKFGWEKVE